MGGGAEAGVAGARLERHPPATSRIARGFDQPLVWVVLALLAFGLVMVYSASRSRCPTTRSSRATRPRYFLSRHALSLAVAFVAHWRWCRCRSSVGALGALALRRAWCCWWLVLVPGIGKGVNGARRWIPLGLMNFQPSELAKLAIALYAASYMVRKMDVKENFFQAVCRWRWRWASSACCCWPSPTWAPSW
jgi:cell division protein FtsW